MIFDLVQAAVCVSFFNVLKDACRLHSMDEDMPQYCSRTYSKRNSCHLVYPCKLFSRVGNVGKSPRLLCDESFITGLVVSDQAPNSEQRTKDKVKVSQS